MAQWGFYFDQSRCLGCKTCVLACKQWNEERRGDAEINNKTADDYMVAAPTGDNDSVPELGSNYIDPETGTNNYKLYQEFYMKESWRRINMKETGVVTVNSNNAFEQTVDRRYLSVSCNHCEKPECREACPVANIYKDDATGAVLRVSAENCISCGRCKDACPWDAPQFYDENFANYPITDPNRPRMTKCTMCLDRINAGLKTACAAACWNRALDAGPIDELRAKYQSKGIVEFDELPELMEVETGADINAMVPNIIFKKKD